jgi:8-oxo-dGTP diphosphatase
MCANMLVEKAIDDRLRQACEKCDFIYYVNPAPASAIILVENDKVLMVKRKYEPKVGDWTLPAGFVENDEDASAAAVREAFEETGLKVEISALFDVLGACDDSRTNVVLIIYLVNKVGGKLMPGDDAMDAKFFPLNELPNNIAFSSHRLAIEKYKVLGN